MVDGGQTKVPRFQPAPTGPFTPAPTEGGSGRDIGGVATIVGGRGGRRLQQTTIEQDRAAAAERAEQQRQSREIPKVTAEANRLARDLVRDFNKQAKGISRNELLRLRRSFQRDRLDLENLKTQSVSNIKKGGASLLEKFKTKKEVGVAPGKIIRKRPLTPPKPSLIVGRETIQIKTGEGFERLRKRIKPKTLKEQFVEAEIGLFPGTIGPRFLKSQLGGQLTSGQITKSQKATAQRVKELLPKTAGFGPEASRAALELNDLIRQTDSQVKRDLNRSKSIGASLKKANKDFDILNENFTKGEIKEGTVLKRQEEILRELKGQGFRIERKENKVNISHPVYDRLQGVGKSGFKNLLIKAREGKSSKRDQVLIGSLDLLDKAFQAEKFVLGFQLGGAGLLKVGAKTPKIVGTIRSKKVLDLTKRLSAASLTGSVSALVGAKRFEETGELTLALTSGLGTLTGFAAAGNANKLFRQLQKANIPVGRLGKEGKVGKAKTQKQVQKEKTKSKKKIDITRDQALKAFSRDSRSKQIDIIEKALKNEILTPLELSKAKRFMLQAGLQNFQAEDRLAEAIRRLSVRNLRGARNANLIEDSQFKQQLKVLRDNKQKIIKILKDRTIQSTEVKISIGGPKIIEQPPQFTNFKQKQGIIQKQINRNQQLLKSKTLSKFQETSVKIRQQNLTKQLSKLQTTQTSKTSQNLRTNLNSLTTQLSNSQTKLNNLTNQASRSLLASSLQGIQRQINTERTLQRSLREGIKKVGRRITKTRLPRVIAPLKRNGGDSKFPKRGIPAQQGYNAFAKQKGFFKKLNKVPITKTQARNLSAFIVDNSTSATGRIRRVQGRKSKRPQTRIPKGYFSQKRKSFRTFRIIKGRRVPLFNEFIELRGKRINTRGEKKGLSIAKALAPLRKPKKIIKRRPPKKIIKKNKKAFKPVKSNMKSTRLIKKRRKK